MRIVIVTLGLSLICAAGWAADRADIEGTRIIGSRELPKVLYIVPWKKPLPDHPAGPPVSNVLDDALAPVDREVFRRQVEYHVQSGARPAHDADKR